MSVHPIDPRPDLRDWAKRYGGPMKIPADGWIDFGCAMEAWCYRHRKSWTGIMDYRKNPPLFRPQPLSSPTVLKRPPWEAMTSRQKVLEIVRMVEERFPGDLDMQMTALIEITRMIEEHNKQQRTS